MKKSNLTLYGVLLADFMSLKAFIQNSVHFLKQIILHILNDSFDGR